LEEAENERMHLMTLHRGRQADRPGAAADPLRAMDLFIGFFLL